MSSGVAQGVDACVCLTLSWFFSSAEEQELLTGDETTKVAEVKAHYRELLAQPIKEEWPCAKYSEQFQPVPVQTHTRCWQLMPFSP